MKQSLLKLLCTLLLLAAIPAGYAQTQYPVSITTSVIPPVSPYFNQLLAPVSNRVNVLLRATSFTGGSMAVRLVGKIECLAPNPFTITLDPNYIPQQPIQVPSAQPVSLTNNLLQQAFGNFVENNLVFSGISLSAIKDGINYKLPEGMYRLCFQAYTWDPSGPGRLASDPNTGCTTFSVCYKAAAPQLTQPVNSMISAGGLPTVNPGSPLIFTWIPPAATCGAAMGNISYDLELRELLPSQAVNDAVNNPYIFRKAGLPSSSFLLDTNLYKHILVPGKNYIVRVKANALQGALSPVEIDNAGYSRTEAFQYGSGQAPGLASAGKADSTPVVHAFAGDCGLKIPANTKLADKSAIAAGKDYKIGDFTFTPSSIQSSGDSTWKGTGTILWQPVAVPLHLAVVFDKIKINSDGQVIDGVISTTMDKQQFHNETFSQLKDLAGKSGTQLDALSNDVENYLNNNAAGHLLSQIQGSTPVDLPLGLNNQTIQGVPVTLAIMNISFSPKGATMSVLFNMNIPEANGWLTLAGNNFCIYPGGLSLSQGTLFLPVDRDFNIGSTNIKFKGCPDADSTAGTYVSWNNNALSDIVAHAEISLPQNVVVPEDKDGNITAGAVVAKLQFKFHRWDDWVASLDLPHFQIKGVKGLSIQPTTLFYDHSLVSNAPGYSCPAEFQAKKGVDFEGLYIKEMKVLLPADFKTFNQSKERTSFIAHDLIIDGDGISTRLQGTKVIDLSTGNLGGWAFSLDTFNVLINRNTFASGSINGKFVLPVSSTALDYSGDLHTGNDSLQYEFVVHPSDKMQFDIWKASVTLKPNSSFTVKKDTLGTSIVTLLNGDISFAISNGTPALKFDALSFDSLGIANRNLTTHKEELWMNIGTWSFAGIPLNKSGAFQGVPWRNGEGLYASLGSAHGPNADMGRRGAHSREADDGAVQWGSDDYFDGNGSGQSQVAGFPISLNHIEPFMGMNGGLQLGVKFGMSINVGFGNQSVISASTGLSVFGVITPGLKDISAPKINIAAKIQVDSVRIKGDVGPVGVDGMLVFYNHDNKFGDGLKGHVVADFKVVRAEATAQFGQVDNYNYWFIDACVAFKPSIPVAMGFGINGFAGGAYYNMSMDTAALKGVDIAQTASNKSSAADATPGKSQSGVSFVPHAGYAGLRAGVLFNMADKENVFNAKVTLTAELNLNKGSFAKLGIEGQAWLITNYPSNTTAKVRGAIAMVMDFENSTFNLNASLDASLSGSSDNNSPQSSSLTIHVPLSIYAGGDGWYLKMGDPMDASNKIRFNLLNVGDDKSVFSAHINAEAYLQLGTLINPQLPPLPDEIAAYVSRTDDVSKLISSVNSAPGGGFMFGAKVKGDLKFSVAILYAKADAVLGFDLALKNFSNDLTCNGVAAGWNNWYALGQIYFYFNLDVGVHVDVWFASGDFPLVSFKAGAALRGGLPNPTWLDGTVFVHGEVLGGLVKVSTNAHFTIGDKCYPDVDALGGIKIITDYGPKNAGGVYDDIYAVSSVPLNQEYPIDVPPTNAHPDGETRIFKFLIREFQVYAAGQRVSNISWSTDNSNEVARVQYGPTWKPKTDYSVKVICTVLQQYPEGWGDPWDDKQQARAERSEVTDFSFRTGNEPDSIPQSAVLFQYPVARQRYVLKQEFGGRGRIDLARFPEDKLLGSTSGFTATKNFQLYLIRVGSADTIKTNFSADAVSRSITYQLPAGLQNNTIYRAEFWSSDRSNPLLAGSAALMVNTQASMSTRQFQYGNGRQIDYAVKSNQLGQVLQRKIPVPLYSFCFRTSQYNSFSDKIAAWGNWSGSAKGDKVYIQNDAFGVENFDDFELKGYDAPGGVHYPPFFSAVIDWDNAKAPERFMQDNVYGPVVFLGFKGIGTYWGADWVRENDITKAGFNRPVYTLDWNQLVSDRPLDLFETGEESRRFAAVGAVGMAKFQPAASLAAGNNSSKAGQVASGNGGTFAIGSSIFQSGAGGFNIAQLSAGVTVRLHNSLIWDREYYLKQDAGLARSMANGYIQLQTSLRNQYSANLAAILSQLGGSADLAWNAVGGDAYVNLNSIYGIMTDNAALNTLTKLGNLNYPAAGKDTRTIRFLYQPGPMGRAGANKSFTW